MIVRKLNPIRSGDIIDYQWVVNVTRSSIYEKWLLENFGTPGDRYRMSAFSIYFKSTDELNWFLLNFQ